MRVRRIENAEGCLLRSSSGNNFGSGLRRPTSAPPRGSRLSHWGCRAKIGNRIWLRISPRRLSGRNSIQRPPAAISRGGRTEAISQREYLPGNS